MFNCLKFKPNLHDSTNKHKKRASYCANFFESEDYADNTSGEQNGILFSELIVENSR